jgi:hypothetical protein
MVKKNYTLNRDTIIKLGFSNYYKIAIDFVKRERENNLLNERKNNLLRKNVYRCIFKKSNKDILKKELSFFSSFVNKNYTLTIDIYTDDDIRRLRREIELYAEFELDKYSKFYLLE